MNRMPTGSEIRALRHALGLTQEQLGAKLRLTEREPARHIRRLEAGHRKPSGVLVTALEGLAAAARVRCPWA